MASIKTHSAARQASTRERVLTAAEQLLGGPAGDFSMRELAAAAKVSFATPFNLFGSKGGILQSLSAARIQAMHDRYDQLEPTGDASDRVLVAVGIATDIMLERPSLNRAVMAGLGAPVVAGGQVRARSGDLWAKALGAGDGLLGDHLQRTRETLPGHLALSFRGALSFWSAGEIPDDALPEATRGAAVALLLGVVPEERRRSLLKTIEGAGSEQR